MYLVTGASGMFGSRVVASLRARSAPVRGLVRAPGRGALAAMGAEEAIGDMDDPASLAGAMEGVEAIFLVSPMDHRIAAREGNVLAAAQAAGVPRIVKLHGAVDHRGDALAQLHGASIAAIRASGLHWSLVSPSSVMETSLLVQADAIREGALYACSGDGRIGFVAADDVGRAAAAVLVDGRPDGCDDRITGPEALSMADVANELGASVGRPVEYVDLTEDEFTALLVGQAGLTPEEVEIGSLLHFRAWKRGDADVVTDTYTELTGEAPTSLGRWAAAHRAAFASAA